MFEQQATKVTLEGPIGSINKDALYLVDFTKITSVEDLVLIFASMGLSFSGHHPHFETIKQFLALDNPIITNQGQPQQPKESDLKLPKLKPIK